MQTVVQRLNQFNKAAPPLIRENVPLVDWLTEAGFFSAPLNKKSYAYEGGLFDYAVKTADFLERFTAGLGLEWERPESPFIIGMFHALHCMDEWEEVVDRQGKTFFGEDFERGKESHYERNKHVLLSGAGEKSVMLLSMFLILSEEEMFCIRYYKGGGKQCRKAIQQFVRLPLVRAAVQMAEAQERTVHEE
jgi:hypothetical protein